MFSSRKIKSFVSRHRVAIIITAAAVLLSLSVVLLDVFYLSKSDYKLPGLSIKEKEEVEPVYAPLTGLAVDGSLAERRPLAVVVENSTDSRPQSGLAKADVIYETVAEGGITRMLAIYQSQDTNEIGPVRSARFYFIDWLSELSAVFVHVGGNISALDEINAKKIPDINQFYQSAYFWRDKTRYAPHNVYTTTAKLYDAVKNRNYQEFTAKKLIFKTEAPLAERPSVTNNIVIRFSTPQYTVSYIYDRVKNDYARYLAGQPHKDRITGLGLRAKNIVVQYESMTNIKSRDGVQTVKIGSIGKGKAIVFLDGKAIPATWEKTSRTTQTKYLDSTGQEIKLNPGQTWYEIVPLTGQVTY